MLKLRLLSPQRALLAVLILAATVLFAYCSNDGTSPLAGALIACQGLEFTESVATDEAGNILQTGGEDQWHPQGDANPMTGPFLEPAFPNPFCPSTTIEFAVPAPGAVTVRILNEECDEICTLLDGPIAAGVHHVLWNGNDSEGQRVPDGPYACVVSVGDWASAGVVVLLCEPFE